MVSHTKGGEGDASIFLRRGWRACPRIQYKKKLSVNPSADVSGHGETIHGYTVQVAHLVFACRALLRYDLLRCQTHATLR